MKQIYCILILFGVAENSLMAFKHTPLTNNVSISDPDLQLERILFSNDSVSPYGTYYDTSDEQSDAEEKILISPQPSTYDIIIQQVIREIGEASTLELLLKNEPLFRKSYKSFDQSILHVALKKALVEKGEYSRLFGMAGLQGKWVNDKEAPSWHILRGTKNYNTLMNYPYSLVIPTNTEQKDRHLVYDTTVQKWIPFLFQPPKVPKRFCKNMNVCPPDSLQSISFHIDGDLIFWFAIHTPDNKKTGQKAAWVIPFSAIKKTCYALNHLSAEAAVLLYWQNSDDRVVASPLFKKHITGILRKNIKKYRTYKKTRQKVIQ